MYLGTMSLLCATILTLLMIHPSTIPEPFTDKNAKLRTMEILSTLHDSIQSAEKGMLSLPTQNAHVMAGLAKLKSDVETLTKQTSQGTRSAMESFTNVKKKIDTMVKMIQTHIANDTTEGKFCGDKSIDAFLRYILVEHPAAFFDPVLQTNTNVEAFANQMKQEQSVDAYRERALALVTILKQRRKFNCNKLQIEIPTENDYKGILPVTELDIKDRHFTFDPLEAQHLFHNPGKLEASLEVGFAEGKEKKKQMKTILRVMQLMTYLKDSKMAKDAKSSKHTAIYVLV